MSETSGHLRGGAARDAADAPQIVFVGDVQGCSDELDELLARVCAAFGDDGFVLHSVGDLVNRGPGTLRVLTRMRALEEAGRAVSVLGNHELHLIMVALELRELGERDTFGDVLESAERDDWLAWLRTRPVAVTGTLGPASLASPFAMVHASVHPEWDLEQLAREAARVERELGAADIEVTRRLLGRDVGDAEPGSPRDVLGRLVSCRSVKRGGWSSGVPNGEGVPWHEAWAKHEHDYGVVYGHWALQGLHVAPGLRGLDTGCVHHGRGRDGFLTAWLPNARSQAAPGRDVFDAPDERFWQIPARSRYYLWK